MLFVDPACAYLPKIVPTTDENLPSWNPGWIVALLGTIFPKVNPLAVVKDVNEKVENEDVKNVFELWSGVVTLELSLKDWEANTLTWNSVAFPDVNSPNPNNWASLDELTKVVPVALELTVKLNPEKDEIIVVGMFVP